jgi:hypothetical protein
MLEALISQIGPPEMCGIEFAGSCDPGNTFYYYFLAVIAAAVGLVVYRKLSRKKANSKAL